MTTLRRTLVLLALTVLAALLAGLAVADPFHLRHAPWFANLDRQMYFFYMTPVVPFLVLATVLVMGRVLGRADAPRERRQTGLLVVGIWVGLVVANFAWMWPVLQGLPITQEMWDAQLWLPSWRAKS